MPNTHRNHACNSGSINQLPFVKGQGVNRCHWSVTPSKSYGEACEKGRECAISLIELLKNNSNYIGANLLGQIINDMDLTDSSCNKGHRVGFFSFLELVIHDYANKHDVSALLRREAARHKRVIIACDDEKSLEEIA